MSAGFSPAFPSPLGSRRSATSFRKLAVRHKAAFVSVGCPPSRSWPRSWRPSTRRKLPPASGGAQVRFSEVRRLTRADLRDPRRRCATPGFDAVRRTIVARSLGYLERLAQEAQGDAALQLELAGAQIQIGRVQGLPGQANLGDLDGAMGNSPGAEPARPTRRARIPPRRRQPVRRGHAPIERGDAIRRRRGKTTR